jgi:probable rRNA maturation factor
VSRGGLEVYVQDVANEPGVPSAAFLEDCARRAWGDAAGELVIRIVSESESAALCRRYLGKPGPTNVLAFPAGETPSLAAEPVPLGDIVICAAVVAREAEAQGKALEAHWAHMVVHGCLHLEGYAHATDSEAAEMEARERETLARLGIEDPYAVDI